MASINSFADIRLDWDGLLDAIQRSPDLQASVEMELRDLTQAVAEADVLKARQRELNALRQEATQRLNEVVVRGKDAAIRVRSVVRGRLGPKSARLVHFRVAPSRKRPRKRSALNEKAVEGPGPGPVPATAEGE